LRHGVSWRSFEIRAVLIKPGGLIRSLYPFDILNYLGGENDRRCSIFVNLRPESRIVRWKLCKRADCGDSFGAEIGIQVELSRRVCFGVLRVEVKVHFHTARQFAAPHTCVKVPRHKRRRLDRCNGKSSRRSGPESTQ
jgi:hypothetical protein